MRAIGVSHTACKDEFRRNLRSHSWSAFSFFIIYAACITAVLPYCIGKENKAPTTPGDGGFRGGQSHLLDFLYEKPVILQQRLDGHPS